MRRAIPLVVEVLDAELWEDPDRLSTDDGRAWFGLDPALHDRPANDTEDAQ